MGQATYLRSAFILIAAAILTLSISAANASPWTRAPKRLFLETKFDYFVSGGESDFERTDLTTYFEYGVAPNFMTGAKIAYGSSTLTAANLDGERFRTTLSGLNEAEVFVQYTVLKSDYSILSAKLSGIRPARIAGGARPQIASDGADMEARLLFGRVVRDDGWKLFVSVESAYRRRFGDPADQIRIDGQIGIEPTDRWLVLIEAQSNLSARNDRNGGADFDVLKLQPSAIWRAHKKWSLRVGGLFEVASRNLSVGEGVFVAVWTEL